MDRTIIPFPNSPARAAEQHVEALAREALDAQGIAHVRAVLAEVQRIERVLMRSSGDGA